MSNDEELAKKVAEYSAVAKSDPNVDVGMLMLNALQSEHQNQVSSKAKKWLYMLSISLPPVGFLFAINYFWFSDKSDAKEVAWTCTILTVVCIAIFAIGSKLLLSSAGTSVDQIDKIKPSDIMQLTQ